MTEQPYFTDEEIDALLDANRYRSQAVCSVIRQLRQRIGELDDKLGDMHEGRMLAGEEAEKWEREYARQCQRVTELEGENEAFWTAVHRSWNIEPRAYFEAESPKNGFEHATAMAVHHMWKREVKDQEGVKRMKEAMLDAMRAKAKVLSGGPRATVRYPTNRTQLAAEILALADDLESVTIDGEAEKNSV